MQNFMFYFLHPYSSNLNLFLTHKKFHSSQRICNILYKLIVESSWHIKYIKSRFIDA